MKDCVYYEEQINLLLDGMLTPSEEAELRIHLAACAACAEKERQLREIRDAAAALDNIEIPAGLHERIMAMLPEVQPPRKNRIAGHWVRGLAAVAACALLGLAILRLPRMGGAASNTAACGDAAAPESAEAGTSGGEAGYNADDDAGAYVTGASDGCEEPAARNEGDDNSVLTEEMLQENMIASAVPGAQMTQKAGEETDGEAAPPTCAVAYAYTGDLAEIRAEMEDFGAVLTEDEDDRVLLLFETGSETERSFLDRLTTLAFQPSELPEGGYILDESAADTLYILMQE